MERRKHPRFELRQIVELGFGKERYIHAEAIDISRSGIRCRTEEEIEVSRTCSIYFVLQEGKENVPDLMAEVVVKRCDPVEEGGYDVGMEFSMLSPDTDRRLVAFVAEAGETV